MIFDTFCTKVLRNGVRDHEVKYVKTALMIATIFFNTVSFFKFNKKSFTHTTTTSVCSRCAQLQFFDFFINLCQLFFCCFICSNVGSITCIGIKGESEQRIIFCIPKCQLFHHMMTTPFARRIHAEEQSMVIIFSSCNCKDFGCLLFCQVSYVGISWCYVNKIFWISTYAYVFKHIMSCQ